MAKKKITKHITPQQRYHAFIRYSNIVFFLVLSTLLALGAGALILMVSGVELTTSSAQPISSSFDEQTIKKLKGLSNDNTSQVSTFPPGRINPFVE